MCLNALFSVLKRKVGKDTQNIKRAVCCSEVGPSMRRHAVCRAITLIIIVTDKLCPEQCIICWSNRNLDLICLSSDF